MHDESSGIMHIKTDDDNESDMCERTVRVNIITRYGVIEEHNIYVKHGLDELKGAIQRPPIPFESIAKRKSFVRREQRPDVGLVHEVEYLKESYGE